MPGCPFRSRSSPSRASRTPNTSRHGRPAMPTKSSAAWSATFFPGSAASRSRRSNLRNCCRFSSAWKPEALGLRVCVVEERHQFILNHQVMEGTTDGAIAVSVAEETEQRFGTLRSISMDKGFHAKDNQVKPKALAEVVVVPEKGKLNSMDKQREADGEFIRLRRWRSAVESAINALERHGLVVRRDHGIVGFERYVAPAVVAPNVQRLGAVGRQQEAERIRGSCKRAA
jgi:transposase, IS5 family